MAVSACIVAALLALLGSIVDLVLDVPGLDQSDRERLTIIVREGEAGQGSDFAEDEQVAPVLVTQKKPTSDDAAPQTGSVIQEASERSVDVEPVRDWHAIAEVAARSGVAEHFSERELQMEMWRQSHSIMFQSAAGFEIREEEPFIPDFRFKPQIHVVGLGFTIGSCFVGIPLAGVPVEQRSVAVTFFVCAEDS